MRSKFILPLLVAAAIFNEPALAQSQSSSDVLTRSDLEAWLDGFMPHALNRDDIAGAVVVVVKDREILLQKGYGYADIAERSPVDAEATLFRLGSVGKLFTWTAVMQLVEVGRLDLDRDINAYLDFSIPPREGKPITLRNLMTHTPGFEEVLKNLATDKPESLLTLDQYVKAWTPRRIFPPGEVPAYCNYGVSLAGYIVQRVSGEPYHDYIDRHVLEPLGMSNTTTRQPLPPRLESRMSKGYNLGSGPEKPFELFGVSPAGSASATGADIGRFMLAYLQEGELGSARILKHETVQQIFGTVLPIIPPLNAMLLGFFQENVDGQRIIGHRGDTQFFHATLSLFVDREVGVFLAINSTGKDIASISVLTALISGFVDRYFHSNVSYDPMDPREAGDHAVRMVGTYESSRRAQSTFVSLLNLLTQVRVTVDGNGGLVIPALMDIGGAPMKWREIEPFVWQQVGGKERLAAKVKDGRVTMFSVDSVSPFVVMQPVAWWKSSAVLNPLLAVALSTILITIVVWPTAALIRRRFGASLELTGLAAKTHLLARLSAIGVIVVLTGWSGIVYQMSADLFAFSQELDPWIRLLRIASLVIFTGAVIVAAWNAWHAWTGKRNFIRRIGSLVLLLSFAVVLWVALAFRLMGFSANY